MTILTTLIEHLIPAITYMMVMLNISRLKMRKREIISAVFALALCSALLFIFFPTAWVEFAAISANIVVIAILTMLVCKKGKSLSLSSFYSVSTSAVVLFSSNLSTQVLVMSGLFETRHARYHALGSLAIMGLAVLLIFILALAISRYYGKFLENKMTSLDTTMQNKFALYMLGGTSVTLVLFFIHTFLRFVIFDYALLGIFYTLALLSYLGFLAFAIFAFTDNFQKEAEVRHQKELTENLETYLANLEKVSVETRKFRHDHKNLLFSFQLLLEDNDMDGLKKRFHEYIGHSGNIFEYKDSDVGNLSLVKTPELRGLLMFKFLRAIQQNIVVHLEISEEITINCDNILDLCRIVGILLDNAVEAALQTKEPEVRFLALHEKNTLTLLLTNSCENVPQLDKLFEKDFSTKGDGRGLGLYTVSQILAENEMLYLRTGIKDGFFEQEISVYT